MNWCVAVLLVEDNTVSVKAMYIRAENEYEAIGKAHKVANRLFPKASVTTNAIKTDENSLITDPAKAGVVPCP